MNPWSGLGDFIVAWPWALLALPLPLLVRWLLPGLKQTSQRALIVPELARFSRIEAEGGGQPATSWLWWLALLCWILVVIAVARPQWLGEPVTSVVSGRDLMLCIDISGSMDEEDLYTGSTPRTRMDVVRTVGRDFIGRRAGDRIGLIMFGSQAYVQTPLTFDHSTVQHFLSEATVGLAGRQTAIGDAIGLGVKRLRDRPQESRVLILLTDGANSAGVVDPIEAANVAAANDIRIHTIGVGADSQNSQSPFGLRIQRSELDEKTLQQISAATGGRYFRARNANELESIYDIIDQIEVIESDDQLFRPLTELFPWPLGMALFGSVVIALLSGWRRRA
ncbi:MAG: VWA domain-containing protein [Granulosicoccus sp.]|nr:VWA domain-containing protein [Granulosicoccus sp.]